MNQKLEKLYEFDRAMLADKNGRQAYVCAGFALGVAVGFLILLIFLPDPEGSVRAIKMISIFYSFTFSLIAYAAFLGFWSKYFRGSIKTVLWIMNWFVFPAIMLGFSMDVYGILSGR